ncbi:DUF305 domain-containing protein [Prauserella muralis]|uniref:Uncharacterized protein n=1 Tax=Prauserella muralis TaxID=588067 RepID=A0A2V4BMQ9_9PSEU|nr:DUF305 domain-containing protein [Prauserella muralis]PXY31933.1 hypothetical protein BAY60_06300 [Prauserella muralis]TWE13642.1 uncharacterized protein (DUF305 family) [Prauserella muralis]
MSKTTLRFVLPTVAVAGLLAGCGGAGVQDRQATPAPESPTREQTRHNDADIAFAQQMIPHHQQAVDMAKLVPSRSSNRQVLGLAKAVERAQTPEIRQLSGWLNRWGAPASGGHGAHGGHAMTGPADMMSTHDLDRLGSLRGREFDRAWLRMMIEHHRGAIAMARTQLDRGADPEARQLARTIIDTQQAEIDTMTALLGDG